VEATEREPARRHRRFSVRVPVDYVIEGRPRSDHAVNLSAGGAYIETSDPQPLGTRIQLRFYLVERNESLDVEGEVTWVNASDAPLDPQTPPGMAFRFDNPISAVMLVTLMTARF
jgi:uncharacterized protein (TIGR02266 family)